jgi:hypothetical protein
MSYEKDGSINTFLDWASSPLLRAWQLTGPRWSWSRSYCASAAPTASTRCRGWRRR